ncbi:flagellar biosynthesis repressor FlbT [Sphingomonas sp. LaA6.9]|uniref:flagellar biosynthesis repressor FlbT n=1 Tax=Sphingomonas sp. LaA6.9 TaxID=2919914 RepID=UPI001F500D5F|nr:flagellar biosynthesis repressor FlbT [Sphingomonas sp. LaA6.9]MCJ8157721.1 flagellar biosynthesis repressor FlbT [Sphingomonas sp. LaA6.9]
MTLRISLRDGEKVIVNGAVLRATGRTQLHVENTAAILRGRDVMSPEEANTPARRLYFACMMAYIDQDDLARHQDAIIELVRELMSALQSPEARAVCVEFAQKAAASEFYRALGDCRWLINYEAEAMARIAVAAE